MNTNTTSEILINATRITALDYADIYEFVLNQELTAIECVRVESLSDGIVFPVNNYRHNLNGELFELNHVRVNPSLDNTIIIATLTKALQDIGVNVNNPPHRNDMAMCYKPLGEITDNVRFHLNETGHFTFLCPNVKLKVINTAGNLFSLPKRFR